jgi:hypothetical protein
MAQILDARLGDEKSFQNITKSLQARLQSEGKIDTVVDSSLLPMFEVNPTIELTPQEDAEIKRKAQEQCDGGADTECMNYTTNNLRQSKLKEKEQQQKSDAYLVKGRRLYVKVRDASGIREFVIPEGQRVQLGGGNGPRITPLPGQSSSRITFSDTLLQVVTALGIILATFAYVFSVVTTYRTFIQAGYVYLGYAATAASVLMPYSGFMIMLIFFTLREIKFG